MRLNKINISNRRYLIYSLCFLVFCALVTAFIMEWRARAGNAGEAMHFAAHSPVPFLIEAAVLLMIMMLISSVLGDVIIGSGIVFGAFVIMTFIHVNKMAGRNEPFIPADFTFILNFGDVAGMTKPMDNVKQIILISCVLLVCITISVLLRRAGMKQLSIKKLPRVRIAAFSFAVVMLLTLTYSFMFPKDIGKFQARSMGFDFNDWDQSINYKVNGFIIGFMYNMAVVSMDEPTGYSRKTIERIIDKYEKRAQEENTNRVDPADSDVNIVYIMNESFCDPNGFKNYFPYTGGNVVPNIERIMSEHPGGSIVSPAFGGGTAIVEFEGLTGFSNWFRGVTLPYHFYVSDRKSFPSVAKYLKANGYGTEALHPYSGLMYDRRPAFKSMGFDKFYDQKSFTYKDKDRTAHYISDLSAYKELLKSLDESNGKKFTLLITMQNHTPYGNQYSEADHKFTSTANVSGEANTAISDYLELLNTSDSALGYLIGELDKSDKKTIVVFWGDHLPGVYVGLPDTEIKKWETPFFIYSNFSLDKGKPERNIGEISPNNISPELMRTAGIKAPAFYYLIDDVRSAEPALVRRYPHNQADYNEALHDYDLIQYDVMSGEGYSLKTNFFGTSQAQH